jgi:ketosteroid isomerase-like protein
VAQQNLESLRRGVDAYRAQNWERWSELYDRDVVWEETPSLGPDASTYRGIENMRAAVQQWIAMWDDYSFDPRSVVDAGDLVALLVEESGRGKSTGATVRRELGTIFEFQGERVVHVRLYGSWADALDALAAMAPAPPSDPRPYPGS